MLRYSVLIITCLSCSLINALTFKLPPKGQDVVGSIQYFTAKPGDKLSNFGMALDVGRDAMRTNNPPFDPGEDLPAGVPVVVPSRFILPEYPHKGIVVNLSTMRLYYYLPNSNELMTYPIGIGKPGHMTPLGPTYVTRKRKDPTWYPPKSIRDYNKKKGIILPRAIQGGPDNPLGRRAIYLAIPQYLIHATNFPESVGSRGSFGCMRMMEQDIEELFPKVAKKTPVKIVEQPFLAGYSKGKIYIEVHTPLAENQHKVKEMMRPVIKHINEMAAKHHLDINWTDVRWAFLTSNGMPTRVSEPKSGKANPQPPLSELLKWPINPNQCANNENCKPQ